MTEATTTTPSSRLSSAVLGCVTIRECKEGRIFLKRHDLRGVQLSPGSYLALELHGRLYLPA